MRYGAWKSWDWDVWTAGWFAWIVFFVVWESITGYFINRKGSDFEMLTDHLRPIFLSVPVLWWLSFGLWLWIGVHMLAPTAESYIYRLVRGA